MQSEDFDIKLRQAADQHHPDYDEKAWSKMEKLLDKYLPQKKDDSRRFLFILLLFLVLGGGVWLFISQPWKEKRNTVQTEQTIQKTVTAGTDETTVIEKEKKAGGETNEVNSTKNKKDKENNNSTSVAAQVTEVSDKDAVGIRAGKKESSVRTTIPSVATKKRNTKEPDQLANEPANKPDSYRVKPDNFVTNDQQDKNLVEPSKPDIIKPADDANVNMKKNEPAKNDNSTAIAPDQKNTDKEKETEKKNDVATKAKNKSKKTNSFFISLSAGPDVSAVGKSKLGKLKLLTGAGVGYTFKDRWTIRTGFYTGNKVYSAAPGYYKLPVPPQNPDYLYEIAADCKVYEIPLSLAYNFNPSKKNSLFAAVGLSSFIMKKEIYDYQYKYPAGPSWTYRHTEENKNRHYFSVLALSAGYERRINKTFSIMAEPYFKIPLAGVGYGKVKLNSAGILVSVNIKPFQ